MFCSAAVPSQLISNSPIRLHFVSAVLVRRELEVDLLREAACCLLKSVSRGHLEACPSIGMYRVPVQYVAGESESASSSLRIPSAPCRVFDLQADIGEYGAAIGMS